MSETTDFEIHGRSLIAGDLGANTNTPFTVIAPRDCRELPGAFYPATGQDIREAVRMAREALRSGFDAAKMAGVFRAVAERTTELRDELLLPRAVQEIGRSEEEATLDFVQMVRQLEMWDDTLSGDPLWLSGSGEKVPTEGGVTTSFELNWQPVGPVVCFPSSSLPFSFGPLGADVISALAAGCPVIIKGNELNAGTTELLVKILVEEIRHAGLHPGYISLIVGKSDIAEDLVSTDGLGAVAFIGSKTLGRAIYSMKRPGVRFFPQYSAANPMFLLRGAMASPEPLARELAKSLTMLAGQFCTGTSVLFTPVGHDDNFLDALRAEFCQLEPMTMLSEEVRISYDGRCGALEAFDPVTLAAHSGKPVTERRTQAVPRLYETHSDSIVADGAVDEGTFGPAVLIVRTMIGNYAQLAAHFPQEQLVASVLGAQEEIEEREDLVRVLTQRSGRVVFNDTRPQIVHIANAQQDSFDNTAVGKRAVWRFLWGTCLQGWGQRLQL